MPNLYGEKLQMLKLKSEKAENPIQGGQMLGLAPSLK